MIALDGLTPISDNEYPVIVLNPKNTIFVAQASIVMIIYIDMQKI